MLGTLSLEVHADKDFIFGQVVVAGALPYGNLVDYYLDYI